MIYSLLCFWCAWSHRRSLHAICPQVNLQLRNHLGSLVAKVGLYVTIERIGLSLWMCSTVRWLVEAWRSNYWLCILIFHLYYLFQTIMTSTERAAWVLLDSGIARLWVGSIRVATAWTRWTAVLRLRWGLISLPVHLYLLKNHQMGVWRHDLILLLTAVKNGGFGLV